MSYPLTPGYKGRSMAARDASAEGAERAKPRVVSAKALAELERAPRGLTAPECHALINDAGVSLHSVRSRLSELVAVGDAYQGDQRREVPFHPVPLTVYIHRQFSDAQGALALEASQ